MLRSKTAMVFALATLPLLLPSLPPAPAPPAWHQPIGADEPNPVCPVCGNPIPFGKGSKVMVRNREYTVDDGTCGDALAANPDKFLDPDGTPKNAKKKPEKPS